MLEVRTFDSGRLSSGTTQDGLVRTASSGGTTSAGGSGVLPTPAWSPTMGSVTMAASELSILDSVDVLICGGGPAGTGAAISAARGGARTLLLERNGYLGGMATAGLVVPHYNPFHNKGLNAEIIERLDEADAWGADFWKISFDPETWRHVTDDLVLDSGSDILFHTQVVATLVEGNAVRGVVIENKSGRFAVLAKVTVDATGDGDVAARAGARFALGREQDGALQPMTTMFRMGGVDWVQTTNDGLARLVEDAIAASGSGFRLAYEFPWAIHLPNPREVVLMLVHVRGVDGTDARALSRSEVDGRRQARAAASFLRDNVPEFAESYLIETGSQIGVRETRRIIGDYVLTSEDVQAGRSFEDGIATVSFPIDIHDPVATGQVASASAYHAPRGAYDIPYRALLPLGFEQLLVAGRCISGTYEAHASYRVKGPCVAMGQAAGLAAAMSVRDGVSPRELSALRLRDELQSHGVKVWASDRVTKVKEAAVDFRPERRARSFRGPL